MSDITEPTKAQKEQTAYARIVRILRSHGLTAEEIEAHPEVANHPGKPSAESIAKAAAARIAAVQVIRTEEKGPAKNGKGKDKPKTPATPATKVPIVDAAAGPPIAQLPPALNGQWGDEGSAGSNEGNAGE